MRRNEREREREIYLGPCRVSFENLNKVTNKVELYSRKTPALAPSHKTVVQNITKSVVCMSTDSTLYVPNSTKADRISCKLAIIEIKGELTESYRRGSQNS